MATKPQIPASTVPLVGQGGLTNKDWLKQFAQQGHVGEADTTATGGAGTLPANPVGFITIYVNGQPKLLPYYDPP